LSLTRPRDPARFCHAGYPSTCEPCQRRSSASWHGHPRSSASWRGRARSTRRCDWRAVELVGHSQRENAARAVAFLPAQRQPLRLDNLQRPLFFIVVLYFLPRLLHRDPAAGCSPSPWVPITSPLSRRGPRVASLPAIRSERSTLCGAQSAVKRAKKASIMIGERYKTDTTSVFRAVREG
jgi:hypothetical protein